MSEKIALIKPLIQYAVEETRVKELMKAPVMIDLRNIYDPREMTANGFDYTGVGRPLRANERPT